MNKHLLSLLLILLIVKSGSSQSIPDDKTVIVEMFANDIFNVDEDFNGIYERENDLISYCANRNYKIVILNRLHLDLPSIFSDVQIITTANNTGLENRMGEFLHSLHGAGISKISGQAPPNTAGSTQPSKFFRNINEFNKRMFAIFGNASYCFDMIYTEVDWWRDDPTPVPINNWNLYLSGIQEMKSQKLLSNTSGYHPIVQEHI